MNTVTMGVLAFFIGVTAATAAHAKQAQGSGGGSGDQVNNPEWFGVTVLEALPPDCTDCTLITENLTIRVFQQSATGDLFQCPFGPVLVTGD